MNIFEHHLSEIKKLILYNKKNLELNNVENLKNINLEIPPEQFNYVDLKTIKIQKFVGFKLFFLIIFKSLYTGCYNVNLHFQYYFTKHQFKTNKNFIINISRNAYR